MTRKSTRRSFTVTILKTVKTIRMSPVNPYPLCEVEETTVMDRDDMSNQSDLEEVDQWQSAAEDEQLLVIPAGNSSAVIFDTGNPPLQRAPGDRVKPAYLLLKELDEIYDWARLACQVCFALCILFLAINAVAIGWLTSSNRPFVFFLFIVINAVGTLTVIFLGKYLLQCDQRVREVIWMLTQHHETDDPYSWPRSTIPRTAIKILFSFTAFALIMLLVVWTGLFVAAL